jgi:hypothetical protein
MSGFLGFVVFLAVIFVAGYYMAKKEANSTPLKRSFNRAALLWNQADPKHRAMMLESIGVFEHSPAFAVYLASTWAQLDLNMCALLAATFDAIRAAPTPPVEKSAQPTRRNPALDELKQLPQTAITAGLIAAMPGLATELYGEAAKAANALGIADPAFADCVFDLQLVGAFEQAMIFTGDRNLASLFVDAMIFQATGKAPSVPSHAEIISGETSEHRGIAKYVLATKHSSSGLSDPGAWAFGAEYARAIGGEWDLTNVVVPGQSVLFIRRTGVWATERALTGKFPTKEEMDALPNAIRMSELLESEAGDGQNETCQLPTQPVIVLPTQKQIRESWEAYKEGPEAMLEWVKKNRKPNN